MSMVTAIFSDSQISLFHWLFAQPERSFHLSKLGSIRINDQWRLCFVWTDSGPTDVELVDYP